MNTDIYISAGQEYVVTDDCFIIRAKNDDADFRDIFAYAAVNFEDGKNKKVDTLPIKAIDQYPEANVFVFQLQGSNFRKEIDAIKKKISDARHPELDYIGSVLKHKKTGLYQIYTGNIIIEINSTADNTSALQAVFSKYGLIEKHQVEFVDNTYFCEFVEPIGKSIFLICQKIALRPEIDFCYPELVVKRRSAPRLKIDVEDRINPKWVAEMIELEAAWEHTRGENVTICVIDDGIDEEHPAFNRQKKITFSKDFLEEGATASHKFANEFHGTAVAGVAASEDPQALGIAPGASLMILRCKGLGSVYEAEAIAWAATNGADIICCSWGPMDGDIDDAEDDDFVFPLPELTRKAIDFATRKGRNGNGCLIFFAAGNGNESINNDGYASYEKVMAIAAVNREKSLTSYTDRGFPLFACFPSSEIITQPSGEKATAYGHLTPDRLGADGYVEGDVFYHFGGTSASAPGMAGVAALMLSIDNTITSEDAKIRLRQSCLLPNGSQAYKRDPNYGWGIINARLLVENTENKKVKNMSTDPKVKKHYAIHIGVDQLDPQVYGNKFAELAGCVNDCNRYRSLTTHFDERITLLNDEATRVNVHAAFERFIEKATTNDVVVFTYAGHGSYIKDIDGDEVEGKRNDETFVLYDGIWIDDETKNLLSQFKSGVQVLMIADSCHSGTFTRGELPFQESNDPNVTFRFADPLLVNEEYERRRAFYNDVLGKLQFRGIELRDLQINANVLAIGACQDDEYAQEQKRSGLFTTAFFDSIKNRNKGDGFTEVFEASVRYVEANRSRMYSQVPNKENYGSNAEAILNMKIDDLFHLSSADTFTSAKAKVEEIESPTSLTTGRTAFSTNNIRVHTPGARLRGYAQKGAYASNERIVDGSIVRNSTSVPDAWDNAYQLYLSAANKDEIEFVEPDIISAVNVDPMADLSTRSGEKRDSDEYISTYPHPSLDDDEGFAWHLGDDFSQLKAAFQDACDNIANYDENLDDYGIGPAESYPLIGHIDTGTNHKHPKLRPIHFQDDKKQDFSLFAKDVDDITDVDRKALRQIAEQQCHGQATMMLLAGGKFDKEANFSANEYAFENSSQFIGGFPFARVISLKISESVILLSGVAFCKALDYCIKENVEVVSMSMAGIPTREMAELINDAYEKGIVVVSAAGNCWSSGIRKLSPKNMLFPARFARTIAATGVTGNYTPYLNEYNSGNKLMELRAVGGDNMQSCYGPEEMMKYSLAAYTPNVPWINGDDDNNTKVYSRKGGGTSSATPQIAAAAALYLHKHRAWFDKHFPKKRTSDRWKKTEVVRQALFRSGAVKNLNPNFKRYFTRGFLKAKLALGEDPQMLLDEIELDQDKFNAPKAKVNFFQSLAIRLLFLSFLRSSTDEIQVDQEKIAEMVALEIQQILVSDSDMDKYDNESSNELPNELVEALLQHPSTSKFLKLKLQEYKSRNTANSDSNRHPRPIVESRSESGTYKIWSNYAPLHAEVTEHKIPKGENGLIASFEVEFDETALRSSAVKIGYSYNTDEDHALLAQATLKDGTKRVEWIFPNEIPAEIKTRSQSQQRFLEAGEQFIWIDSEPGVSNRGLGDWLSSLGGKVKSLLTQVYRTVLDKPVAFNEGLVFAEIPTKVDSSLLWKEIAELPINNAKAKYLLLLHGTWSQTAVSFEDLLNKSEFRKKVKDEYGKRILGFEMSTIKSGVRENARDLLSALKSAKINVEDVEVIAFSRGCLVAREAFKNVDIKMVLCAGPHLGTPMATRKNIITLLNIVTNMSIKVAGVGTPLALGIMSLVTRIANGIFSSEGLLDQALDSRFLAELNECAPISKKSLLIAANYRPSSWPYFLDKGKDFAIFRNRPNDGIIPTVSTKGIDDTLVNKGQIEFISCPEIDHFNYFTSQKIVEKVCSFLSK